LGAWAGKEVKKVFKGKSKKGAPFGRGRVSFSEEKKHRMLNRGYHRRGKNQAKGRIEGRPD